MDEQTKAGEDKKAEKTKKTKPTRKPKREGPLYKHDCESCVWIATIAHPVEGKPCDLYACPGDATMVKARYSKTKGDVRAAPWSEPKLLELEVAVWLSTRLDVVDPDGCLLRSAAPQPKQEAE